MLPTATQRTHRNCLTASSILLVSTVLPCSYLQTCCVLLLLRKCVSAPSRTPKSSRCFGFPTSRVASAALSRYKRRGAQHAIAMAEQGEGAETNKGTAAMHAMQPGCCDDVLAQCSLTCTVLCSDFPDALLESWFCPADDILETDVSDIAATESIASDAALATASSSAPGSSAPTIWKARDDSYFLARAERKASRLQGTKKKWNKKVKQNNESSTAAACADEADDTDLGGRLRKQPKAAQFLAWMMETFPSFGAAAKTGPGYVCMKCGLRKSRLAALRQAAAVSSETTLRATAAVQCPVVDVAGGRGQLAFYVAAFYSIPVTVCDPAPMNLARFEQQYARKQEQLTKQRTQQQESKSHEAAEHMCELCGEAAAEEIADASAASAVPPSPSVASASAAPPSRTPLPWLPHLRHCQCMFPDSISLSLHKNHGKTWKRIATVSTRQIIVVG
jgi:hypothetical protein